jgi:hypothetical protein
VTGRLKFDAPVVGSSASFRPVCAVKEFELNKEQRSTRKISKLVAKGRFHLNLPSIWNVSFNHDQPFSIVVS